MKKSKMKIKNKKKQNVIRTIRKNKKMKKSINKKKKVKIKNKKKQNINKKIKNSIQLL